MINKFKAKLVDIGFIFNIDLQSEQNLYCFIGKNGSGKTKLLENMAKSLIFSHSIFGVNTKKATNHSYEFKRRFYLKGIFEHFKDEVLFVPQYILINDHIIKDPRMKWGYTTFLNIFENRNSDFIYDKPIVFIGAKNRGFVKNTNPNNFKILSSFEDRFVKSLKRTLAYIHGQRLEQEEIADWFISRLMINSDFISVNQDKSNEVFTVCQLIEKLEPDLKLVRKKKDGRNEFNISYAEGQLIFNRVPLDQLPSGFVAIIKIFQEIVAGYGGWFAENIDLKKVDGIVFIDEIETHLHLSWQTKIINLLKDFFPNTTFYISTHSPLVLSALKDGEAYELELYPKQKDKIIKAKLIEHVEQFLLNDIIKEYFDTDLNQIKIDNPNREKQEKVKSKLIDLIQTMQEEE